MDLQDFLLQMVLYKLMKAGIAVTLGRYRLSDGFFEEEYLPFVYSLEIYT